ncbi:MAG: ATP-binding protein [Planctomycetes bacterium]|nr:ATP-binding protein [Planctomycetota bacterium]
MTAEHQFDTVIPSDTRAGLEVQERILDVLQLLEYSARDLFAVRLAVEEALVNAIKHGNGMDPDKQVKIACRADACRVRIEIEDEGDGFHPEVVPDPTFDGNINRPGGRGVMLIRSFMSSLSWNDRGNRLVMERLREA